MAYLDQAVLDLTEWLCRRFQTWTGRTNVWLAFQLTNLSVIVYFVWVIDLYWITADALFRAGVAFFCGALLWLLSRTILRTPIDFAESQAYARIAKGLRNPRRMRDAQLRITFLTMSVVLSYPLWLAYITLHQRFVIFMEASVILTTIVLYVLACDPLPPCPGKVWSWLRAFSPATAGPVAETD